MCCSKVALVKLECLEVETGRFQIYAVQEGNIYAKVSCEMQEVQGTLSKAARGGLGSGSFGVLLYLRRFVIFLTGANIQASRNLSPLSTR